MQAIPHSQLALTPEAQGYVTDGKSPEVVVFDAVPADGGEMAAVQQTVAKPIWALGFKKAMEKRWIKMDKQDGKQLLTRQTDAVEDVCLASLQKVAAQEEVDSKAIAELKKRKLVKVEQWKTFKVSKGPAFSLERVKQETDLTVELLQSGEWRSRKFKDYNFDVRHHSVAGLHSGAPSFSMHIASSTGSSSEKLTSTLRLGIAMHSLLRESHTACQPRCGCAGAGPASGGRPPAPAAQGPHAVPQDLHADGLHGDAHEQLRRVVLLEL